MFGALAPAFPSFTIIPHSQGVPHTLTRLGVAVAVVVGERMGCRRAAEPEDTGSIQAVVPPVLFLIEPRNRKCLCSDIGAH